MPELNRRPRRTAARNGAVSIEFALVFSGVLVPVTFGLIFTAQLLWIWHSINEFTRQGASYASTHCWESSGGNVLDFMRSNVPPMPGQAEFLNGGVQIQVSYFGEDPATGLLSPFECDGDCSTGCIPDLVTVSITGLEYRAFTGMPAITLPNFQASLPMQSAGCDPETGICLP
jgi:hypothetical protein